MITCIIFFTKRRVESPFRSEMFKHLSKVRMLLNMFDVHVPYIRQCENVRGRAVKQKF